MISTADNTATFSMFYRMFASLWYKTVFSIGIWYKCLRRHFWSLLVFDERILGKNPRSTFCPKILKHDDETHSKIKAVKIKG